MFFVTHLWLGKWVLDGQLLFCLRVSSFFFPSTVPAYNAWTIFVFGYRSLLVACFNCASIFAFCSVIRFSRSDEIMVGRWGLLQIYWYPMYGFFIFTWISFDELTDLFPCFIFLYLPPSNLNITRRVSEKSSRFCLFLFARPPKLTYFLFPPLTFVHLPNSFRNRTLCTKGNPENYTVEYRYGLPHVTRLHEKTLWDL